MMFYSRSNPRPHGVTPAGSGLAPVYSVRLDPQGHKEVYQSGQTDLYAKIQASLEETKVENIVRRFLQGDTAALSQTSPVFLDVSAYPGSLMEANNLIVRIKSEFWSLPLDVRQEYGNNPDKYVADYGSDNWAKLVGFDKPQTLPEVQPENPSGGDEE